MVQAILIANILHKEPREALDALQALPILLLMALFYLVFHMTLNCCNTNLKMVGFAGDH